MLEFPRKPREAKMDELFDDKVDPIAFDRKFGRETRETELHNEYFEIIGLQTIHLGTLSRCLQSWDNVCAD